MSLGAWMREYVFYPVMLCRPVSNLSKKMRKKHGTYAGKLVPSVAAPMVVFFLIGIWHGITSQYIVNGLYNAILISGSVAMIPVYKKLIEKLHINTETFSYKLFQIARTTILLFISRIIVKAPSLEDALLMIKALFTTVDFDFLFGFNGEIYAYGVSQKEMSLVIFSILILLVVGVLQENGLKIRETLANLDGNKAMDELNESGNIKFDADGTEIVLTKDDLLIDAAQVEGFASESDFGITVVLDIRLTDELMK